MYKKDRIVISMQNYDDENYFTSEIGQNFIYNAEFSAGHWVDGMYKDRIVISITSG